MQAIFESLAVQQQENTKELKSLSDSVADFYKEYKSKEKKEEKDRKKEANDKKRKGADPDSFISKLKKEQKGKKKGGILGDLFGDLTSLIKAPLMIGALGAGITGGLLFALSNSKVRQGLSKLVTEMATTFSDVLYNKILVPLSEWARDTIPFVNKSLIEKGSDRDKLNQKSNEADKISQNPRSSSADLIKAGKTKSDVSSFEESDGKINEMEKKIRSLKYKKKIGKDSFNQLSKLDSVGRWLSDPMGALWYNDYKDLDRQIKEREEWIKTHKKRQSMVLDRQGLQSGGPVKVKGSGYGDRVPMSLPAGSFVLNKKASAYLQNGGKVPTMLEPGEKVYGPGQWDWGIDALNKSIPRKSGGYNPMDPKFMTPEQKKKTNVIKYNPMDPKFMTPKQKFTPTAIPDFDTLNQDQIQEAINLSKETQTKTQGGLGGFLSGFKEGFMKTAKTGLAGIIKGMFEDTTDTTAPKGGGDTNHSSGISGNPPQVTAGSKGLLDFIAHYESDGDYNKIFGGASIAGLTDKTINEVVQIQKAHLRKGYESAAIGRYQMMLPEVYADKAGVGRNEKFSKENQDKMAMVYLEEDGWSKFKSGKMSADAFANNIAGTWAAMPMPGGQSAHAGVGSNKSGVDRDTFMKHVRASKKQSGGIIGFQSGGMVPTMLEPGEKVYGPGQWDQSIMNMNSSIPRFQNGGVTGMSGGNPNYGLSAMQQPMAMQPIIINAGGGGGGGGGGGTHVENTAAPEVPSLPVNSGHPESHYLEMILAKNIGG